MQLAQNRGVNGAYRYAFNGMEKDDEISGEGNAYHTTFRGYDPRLARWKSLDPLFKGSPDQSPFVGMGNNPINLNDTDGLEPKPDSERKKARKVNKYERKADRYATQNNLDIKDPDDYNQIKAYMDERYGSKNWYYVITDVADASSSGNATTTILSDYYAVSLPPEDGIIRPTTVNTDFNLAGQVFLLGNHPNLTPYSFNVTPDMASGGVLGTVVDLSISVSLTQDITRPGGESVAVTQSGVLLGSTSVSLAREGILNQPVDLSRPLQFNINFTPGPGVLLNVSNQSADPSGTQWSVPKLQVSYSGTFTNTRMIPYFAEGVTVTGANRRQIIRAAQDVYRDLGIIF